MKVPFAYITKFYKISQNIFVAFTVFIFGEKLSLRA